jgi:hypothetical protein
VKAVEHVQKNYGIEAASFGTEDFRLVRLTYLLARKAETFG